MKRYKNFWLLAALVFGLGITVTSCSDDDEDEPKSEEQKEQEAQQKASNFWNVVGQLVSVDDVTDDYEGKTFEPTYGLPDATNATTRIVNTNDMKTAAQRFANLVDAKGINENTASYTWSDPEIGSMTYTRGGDPSNWATVDVDIKAVPGLQRIIYREGGEGDNGKFQGLAYYRFGDVVSRKVTAASDPNKTNDHRGSGNEITEYWICVRPAFGPEGKEDSHWVCVNTVTDKNYKYYRGSNDKDYWLPTKLGTDKENMQNFAEMLYAICYPDTWYKNADEKHKDGLLWGFDGVPIFTDFTHEKLELHNKYFWRNVSLGWDKKEIAEKALNLPNLGALIDVIKHDGVRLLYKGYSWWFTTSWNCELWEAVYTNGTKDEEQNMHHVEYNNPEKNMQNVNFDVRDMGKNTYNYYDFFGNGKYRWVIRHATGKELAGNKKLGVKEPIPGMTEEYRYYHDMNPKSDLIGDPEPTKNYLDKAYENRGYYDYGDVVEDKSGNNWFCVQPSAFKSVYETQDLNIMGRYAYFISFDEGAVGKWLENVLSSKELAMQMFFDLSLLHHNRPISDPVDSYWGIADTNIKKYAGVDLMEVFAIRDSLVKHQNELQAHYVQNSFLSTFYRENNDMFKWYIFRGIGDFTHDDESGAREWTWNCWTCYTKDPERKMEIDDLIEPDTINLYNKDPWVHNAWYDWITKQKVYTNIGPRTLTESIMPYTHFIYVPGRTAMAGTAPANMYREPLYAFTVKRVWDEGKPAESFEDGTLFYPVRLMKEVWDGAAFDELSTVVTTIGNTYSGYKDQRMYLNNVPYQFGLMNKP